MGKIDLRDPSVQIALIVTLCAITIGHVFFLTDFLPFGYQKRQTDIATLESEYENLSADLMKAKQTASRLPQVRAEFEALSTQWEEAKGLLPTEQEMAEVLSHVTVAGQRSNVEFLLFQPQPATPHEIYLEHPIDVTVTGGYHEVGMFLSRVSNLPRIINVNSVDMKNVKDPDSEDEDAPEVVEATMSLAAYTLNPAGATPPPAPPAAAPKRPMSPKPIGGTREAH
jgi:type IV pilus assembly protein PilO